jgi:hypothetical protein
VIYMAKSDLINLAKELKLADQRELVAKVVISYSNLSKALNVAFSNTQGAGTDGFVGIYQDQLVCFDANLLGTKPHKERFRMSFEFIRAHTIKKGFLGLNNQFLIETDTDRFKLYFMKKRLPMIQAINQAITLIK